MIILKPSKRNELIMIPIPKPKFFERKVPVGRTEDEYFNEILKIQTHILRDAIDRVSLVHKLCITFFIIIIFDKKFHL